MSDLLLITGVRAGAAIGGRALLSQLHREVLCSLDGIDVGVHELPTGGVASQSQGLRGYIDGVTPDSIAAIIARVREEGVSRVWLDGSNLGRLAEAIKRALPHVEVLTFCHNCEARFFLGAFRARPRVHSLGVFSGNYVAERFAARNSDSLITLSERDSSIFKRFYGRGATAILPMAMIDRLSPDGVDDSSLAADDAPVLFVGGAFYANQTGIAWFARNVARRLPIRTVVVGHGTEAAREALEAYGNVEVVGGVDRLEPWYRSARVVIAPIFDGSGMKTKVAEALMFGKRIVGTREAFSGYEAVAAQAGWRAETPDEFARAIGDACTMPIKSLDASLRALYQRHYSKDAAKRGISAMLGLNDDRESTAAGATDAMASSADGKAEGTI